MNIELWVESYSSPDILDFEGWSPQDTESFVFLLEMEVGRSGSTGTDLFTVLVASPNGIKSMSKEFILRRRGCILVDCYSWEKIRKEIDRIVEHCSSETWEECIVKLQKYFIWEYEDMGKTKEQGYPLL